MFLLTLFGYSLSTKEAVHFYSHQHDTILHRRRFHNLMTMPFLLCFLKPWTKITEKERVRNVNGRKNAIKRTENTFK